MQNYALNHTTPYPIQQPLRICGDNYGNNNSDHYNWNMITIVVIIIVDIDLIGTILL